MTINYWDLAIAVDRYCEERYNSKDARYDVIVECMTIDELSVKLEEEHVSTIEGAYKWADDYARLQYEVELNQAWDGAESCIGSSKYNGLEYQ